MVQTSAEYKITNENIKKMALALIIIACKTKTKRRKIEYFLTGSNRIMDKTLYEKILSFLQEENLREDIISIFHKYQKRVLINSFSYEELCAIEKSVQEFMLAMIPRREKVLYQLCCES